MRIKRVPITYADFIKQLVENLATESLKLIFFGMSIKFLVGVPELKGGLQPEVPQSHIKLEANYLLNIYLGNVSCDKCCV